MYFISGSWLFDVADLPSLRFLAAIEIWFCFHFHLQDITDDFSEFFSNLGETWPPSSDGSEFSSGNVN